MTQHNTSNKRYPYMLRGRVEVATFTCPCCNDILKFRGRTTFKKKCPSCQTILYVFLRVCVGRGVVRQLASRPIDTILPVTLTPTQPGENPLAASQRRSRELAALQHPLEGEPRSQIKQGAAKRLQYEPAGSEVDEFVAELGELGVSNAIEPLPNVGMGRWTYGERAHRVVDLDELSERGERFEIEQIEQIDEASKD